MRHPEDFGPEGKCFRKGHELFFADEKRGRPAIHNPPPKFDPCAGCAVLEDCAAWAVAREAHGFWGGLSASERVRLRAEQGVNVRRWA